MRLVRTFGVGGALWFLLAAAACPAAPPAPGRPAPAAPAPGIPPGPARKLPRLALASYYYWYQADPRKPLPITHARGRDGGSTLASHPWDGTGPWFSYDRVLWHKNQLQTIRDTGIDVILPVYASGAVAGAPYAVKGLDCLAQALAELKADAGQPFRRERGYPLVGMWLDLGAVRDAAGGPVDLATESGRRALYGVIQTFYRHVPSEFRAPVALRPDAPRPAGGPDRGHIVVLAGGGAVKTWDAAALSYCAGRFAQEFGAGIVWIGGPDVPKAPGLDGAMDLAMPPAGGVGPAAPGAASVGWLKVMAVRPLADRGGPAGGPAVAERLGGQAFIQNFLAALRSSPDWIVVDSWNRFESDTDVSPSHEFGLQPTDLTRAGLAQFKSTGDFGATILRATVPAALAPKTLYQVEVLVENTGQKSWGAQNRAGLSYRWYQDGKPVGDAGPLLSASGVIPGAARTFTMGLTSPMSGSRPLPDGRYELRLDMLAPPDQWFAGPDSAPLSVMVEVGKPPVVQPTWLGSDLPKLVKSGASYTATVRLRNDGTETWRKGRDFAIGYRWRRVAPFRAGGGAEADEPLNAAMVTAPLPADVPPGAVIPAPVTVRVAGDRGAPLPVWDASAGWSYDLEWGFSDGKNWITGPGASYREGIAVLPVDPGPSFLGAGLASELVAGQALTTNVGVRNAGPESWKPAETAIGTHWYYFDGTEALWAGGSVPLPKEIAPGETVIVRDLPVKVPDYNGPMYLVCDLLTGGAYASTGPNSRGSDILVLPVLVRGGRMTAVDLSGVYNADGISTQINRTDGDLDGKGGTLPAELLPPYVWRPPGPAPLQTALYPCGLWSRPVGSAPGASGPAPDTVTFRFPEKRDRAKNVVSCSGQRVEFPSGTAAAVHLLGCATAPDAAGSVTLVYKDGSTVQQPLTMSLWTSPPAHGEHVAFTCRRRHTPQGDDAAAYLNHYTIPVDRSKALAALLLPENPAMKVFAVTLEGTELRPPPATAPTAMLTVPTPPPTQAVPTRRRR